MKQSKILGVLTLVICLSLTASAFAVNPPTNLVQYKPGPIGMSTGDWINDQWITDNGWQFGFRMNKEAGVDFDDPPYNQITYTFGNIEIQRDTETFTGSVFYTSPGAQASENYSYISVNMQSKGEGRYKWRGQVSKTFAFPSAPGQTSSWADYAPSDFHFGIDRTKPEITKLSSTTHNDEEAWYNKTTNPIINIEATDPAGANGTAGSGPGRVSYNLTENTGTMPDSTADIPLGTTWEQPLNLSSLPSGIWIVGVRVLDAAGNIDNFDINRNFRQIKIDMEDPVISNLSSDGGVISNTWQSTNGNPTFTIDANDEYSGVNRYKYNWGPSPTASPTIESASNIIGPLSAPQGEYYLRVNAYDSAAAPNGSVTSTFTYKFDSIAPGTEITFGPNGTISYKSATFNFHGTENAGGSGKLTYSYRLDGGVWSSYSTLGGASYNDITPGNHTFEVRAKDAAGNEDSTPASRTFTYSPPAPPATTVSVKATPGNQAQQPSGGAAQKAKKKAKKKVVKKRVQTKHHMKKCSKNKKFHAKHCKSIRKNKRKTASNKKYHKKVCTKVIKQQVK